MPNIPAPFLLSATPAPALHAKFIQWALPDWALPYFWDGKNLTLLAQAMEFVLVIGAAMLVARLVRYEFRKVCTSRFRMERGHAYALSKVIHYAIMIAGFYVAISMTGIDMMKFNILIGAFTVGIGFGLQNVINNFISGLILLFERPVKVGDTIKIGADTGVIEHIYIRASTLRTPDGAEIIIPNSKLISDQVTKLHG